MSLDDVDSVRLVDSVDAAGDLMRWLSTKDEISYDTESTGLDLDRDRLRLVQVGDARTAWAIPWERWGGVVAELVAKFDGWYVMHNAPHDRGFTAKERIEIPIHKIHDTRIMAHVLESTGSLALKKLSTRLVDPRAAALQDRLDDAMSRNGWTWATVPIDYEMYWAYGALDTVLTAQLKDELWPRVQADAPRSYDLERAVLWPVQRMERRGVRVDREYTAQLHDAATDYAARAGAWVEQAYGVSAGSNDRIVEILRRDGVSLTKMTPSGAKYALDKDVLGAIDHPLARVVLARRRAVKLAGTYLRHYLDLSVLDGRVHPSINTVGGTDKNPFEPGGEKGVRTGRMSSNGPNMQNVPIRTEQGKRIRNCFVPSEGCYWVKADFDQIEMRILTWFARDPAMLHAFTTPGDFFVNLARMLFDDPTFAKTDPRRQMVKNAGYAKVYGAKPARFSATAGVDVATGTAFLRRFDALFPGVVEWIARVESAGRQRLHDEGEAYVRSPMTGRKHVGDSRIYPLVNYLIQGLAGELLKLKVLECDAAGLADRMTLLVHDEFDADVPVHEVDDYVTSLRDVLNDDRVIAPVPVRATIEVGPRWGTTEEVA